MSRSSTLILLGFLVLIVSFMGVPLTWLHVLLPLFGLIIIIIGFLIRVDAIATLERQMPPPPAPAPNEISPIA